MPIPESLHDVTPSELYIAAARLLLLQGDNQLDGTYLFMPDAMYGKVMLTDYSTNLHQDYSFDPDTEDPGPAKRRILEKGEPIMQVQPGIKVSEVPEDVWLFRPESLSQGQQAWYTRGLPEGFDPAEAVILAKGRPIPIQTAPFLYLLLQ